MSYKIQSSFSAGELDPALHERTTLDKYSSGLATLRNAVIGKTGRIISRSGTMFFAEVADVTQEDGIFTAAISDVCTKAGHGFGTGTVVRVNSTGTLPAGLSSNTDYYVSYRGKDSFFLCTSLANAELAETFNGSYNVDITDTGVGTHTITPVEVTPKKAILYSPPYSDYLIEIGHRYTRTYTVSTGNYVQCGHNFTEDDLPYLQFASNKDYLFISRLGKHLKRLTLSTGVFTSDTSLGDTVLFSVPSGPASFGFGATSGTGYAVDYVFTYVENGQESLHSAIISDNLPQAAAESNVVNFTFVGSDVTEIRAYRRPTNGAAFGYVGSGTVGGGTGQFIDYGLEADYTHSPPTRNFILSGSHGTVESNSTDHILAKGRCVCIYQQKLILTREENEEIVDASRTGFQNNFLRDYPLSADSALTFKCGSTGYARVLTLLDSPNGLLLFTTVGIFQNTGALSPDNLATQKVGNWVIEEKVPPLAVPGGVLFVDKSTNTIRSLIFSNEAGGFPGEELSIFSNHLFVNKRVVSWAFQDGDIPLIWVVMDDGSLNCLTYMREHQMQAWSRCDTEGGLYESVAVVKDLENKSVVYFVVNRDGTRYIEYTAPRFVDNFKDFVGMDSAVTFKSDLSEDGAVITVTADDINDWSGTLYIESDTPIFTNTADNGAVGTVFRFFDSEGSAVDLEVTAFTDTSNVTVTPSCEFPSDQGEEIKLYKTYSELTGLDHLNGKFVSLMVDGYVIASPKNNIDGFDELTVSGGTLTIPDGERGAFIHVGLPFVSDVETLDIDTVEQKPALLESKIVHSLYLKVHNSRGLYVGSEFPVNDYVEGMIDPETRTEDDEFGNIGNAAQEPYTKRHNISVPNDWNKGGRVCIRQVDPLPFEILSIIPDLAVVI